MIISQSRNLWLELSQSRGSDLLHTLETYLV